MPRMHAINSTRSEVKLKYIKRIRIKENDNNKQPQKGRLNDAAYKQINKPGSMCNKIQKNDSKNNGAAIKNSH